MKLLSFTKISTISLSISCPFSITLQYALYDDTVFFRSYRQFSNISCTFVGDHPEVVGASPTPSFST